MINKKSIQKRKKQPSMNKPKSSQKQLLDKVKLEKRVVKEINEIKQQVAEQSIHDDIPIIDAQSIQDILLKNIKEDEEKPQEINENPSKLKLYLNNIIETLIHNPINSLQTSIEYYTSKIIGLWKTESANDLKDLFNFVFLHGILGSSIILSTLLVFRSTIPIVSLIQNSVLLSLIVFIIGTGSLYYIFIDTNKALKDTWSRKK